MSENNVSRGLKITTEPVKIRLEKGLYRLILGKIQTADISDSFSIVGEGQWLLSNEKGSFCVINPDCEKIYTAEQLQDSLVITIQVLCPTSFSFKTIDSYDYGDRNLPTNPTITLEIEEENTSSNENIITKVKNNSVLVGAVESK